MATFPTTAAVADNAEIKQVPADGVRRPWHTTDLYWNSTTSVDDVQDIGVTFTVDRDVPDSVNLYIAPMGGQYLNKIMFYGGIQSNVNGWPSPTDRQRVHPGPGAIFSRWGGEPVSIDAAKPVEGGLCESAGYEGEFVSVRKPIVWKAGTYTWQLRREETVQINDTPHTWFSCYLTDHDRDNEHRVGALRFEGDTFSFNGRSTSFVEIYATTKIPRSAVPRVSVTFQPPIINGEQTTPQSVSVYHPRKGNKGSPSPAIGRATAVDGGIQVELHNEVLTGDDVPPSRYTLTLPPTK
ncbi:DUF3472 domain-containing protein [Allorhodopirellula solitaria]|uniref:Uncharacterized protein n=1 Tax=Allorhodopirellula solitaria TaxID=2527987 RepID=A0A5C5WMF4_9BACT|nr:hypothetical protein [Allorhodopirellula solitaria]TWT51994.1 hypothetical protein CA85_51320 [Allorhodopirellula solitaria]